jgi:hypothetical protein
MATEARSRQWRPSVERALAENAIRERYELRQRELRRGRGRSQAGHARPLEFDESGFPIPQPAPGFMQRVGRLINGD